MMKQIKLTFLLAMLFCMVGPKTYAYDIAVENADGVTIYYKYINNGKDLEVTCREQWYEARVHENNYWYSGNVVIPEEVTYMNRTRKVTTIGGYAFYSCRSLTSITIPNSVTSIGEDAFDDCSGLKMVNISDIVTWCNIIFYNSDSNPLAFANHLFLNGDEVTNLVIPNSVTSIGDFAFYRCSGLTSVTIPNSVTSIGYEAFLGCESLTSVTIPNSVTTIGESTFYGCKGLTSVTIPNSVTTIGSYAFLGCESLTSVTIPNSVTTIGDLAFDYCSSLTSVTIGNSVTKIGKKAFYYDDILTVISLIENPFEISSTTFSKNTLFNSTLYVPIESIDKYKTTGGWKEFMFISEIDVSDIKNVSNEKNKETDRFSIDGQRIIVPKKGVNIIKMSDGSTKKVLVQ